MNTGNAARFATEQGTVTVTQAGITIPKTAGGPFAGTGRWASLLGQTRTIPARDVHQVTVTGRDRQYVTGARAAGVIMTGGVALLAPARMRGLLVVSTRAGAVYEFTLLRHDASRPEAIAAAFAARGYAVR